MNQLVVHSSVPHQRIPIYIVDVSGQGMLTGERMCELNRLYRDERFDATIAPFWLMEASEIFEMSHTQTHLEMILAAFAAREYKRVHFLGARFTPAVNLIMYAAVRHNIRIFNDAETDSVLDKVLKRWYRPRLIRQFHLLKCP